MPDGAAYTDPSFDEQGNRERIARLRNAGVVVWSAERVFVGAEVPLDRIEKDAVLMNAVIRGGQSCIGAQARIGTSGTAVLTNTQVGRAVELGAGSYEHATLFDSVKVRGFAEIRQGTVLEETAEAGHNVGLKHTFLSTGVVAGSCINFCDLLMTGGSSRTDHSEIGSGTVHFNFDPHVDKFGSLFGDIRGLLLRQRRIFIGGNCGIVAPVRVGFGAVVAAGTTLRRDLETGQLYLGESAPQSAGTRQFEPHRYYSLRRKLLNTAALAGNLQALEAWYAAVRLASAQGLEQVLCEGAIRNVRIHLEHRARELDKLIAKLELTAATDGDNPFSRQHRKLIEKRQRILEVMSDSARSLPPASFMEKYTRARSSANHRTAIGEMPHKLCGQAELWLSEMASRPETEVRTFLE